MLGSAALNCKALKELDGELLGVSGPWHEGATVKGKAKTLVSAIVGAVCPFQDMLQSQKKVG